MMETLCPVVDLGAPTPARVTQPFLKWAGGKRWLAQRYPELLPTDCERHIEPFAGSSAIFFYTAPHRALLNDANAELIGVYRDMKYRWKALQSLLAKHAALHSDEYYYIVRATVPGTQIQRSARFLYLNRSCWNGLYRVNKQGIFNVPRGTKDVIVSPTDDFAGNSAALQNAELCNGDFGPIIRRAGRGDFLFVDPPYTVAHNLNGFVKYNDQIFSWADQIRLRDELVAAAARGASILLTNADHRSVRDLYDGIGEHLTLSRSTVISGISAGRQRTTELALRIGY